ATSHRTSLPCPPTARDRPSGAKASPPGPSRTARCFGCAPLTSHTTAPPVSTAITALPSVSLACANIPSPPIPPPFFRSSWPRSGLCPAPGAASATPPAVLGRALRADRPLASRDGRRGLVAAPAVAALPRSLPRHRPQPRLAPAGRHHGLAVRGEGQGVHGT